MVYCQLCAKYPAWYFFICYLFLLMALHVRYSSLSPFYRGENWVSQRGGGSLIVTLSHRQMRMDAGYEPSWKDPKATAFNLHSVNLFAPTSLAAQLLRLESRWLWRPTVYPEEVTPPPGTQSSQSGKRQNKPLAFNFLKLPRDLQSSPQGRQKSSLEWGGFGFLPRLKPKHLSFALCQSFRYDLT